jgi:hypothetical protein
MKARFGWTMDSKMLATYEHQAGVDVDECFLRHHGIDVEAEKPKTMEPRICPRGHKNSPSALYCSTCGLPLEEKELIGYQEEIEERGKGEDVFKKCGISKESVFDRLDQVLTKFILSDPVIIDRLYDRIKRSEEYQGLIENLTRKAVMDLLMEDKTKTVHLKSTPELNQKLNELFKKKHVVTKEDLEKMGLVDD